MPAAWGGAWLLACSGAAVQPGPVVNLLLACACKRHAALLASCAGWCAMWRRMRRARTGTSTSWRRPARAPASSAPTSQTGWRGCVLDRLICPHEAADQDIFADDYTNVTSQPTGLRGTLMLQKAEKRRNTCICVVVGGFEMLSPQGCDVQVQIPAFNETAEEVSLDPLEYIR